MNHVLRHGGALVLVIGMGGCTPPDPPVLAPAPAAPAAIAPAREPASNDDEAAHRPIEGPAMFTAGDGGEDQAARAVVSVALDHAGEVLIGQPFSELQGEAQWHSAGLGESTAGRCEYYERGTLPEGVAMMVQDGDVVRFDLAPTDDSGQVVLQPGPFGLHLGMPRAQAFQQLPKGVSTQPYGDDAEAGESLLWQDPGSDLAIRVEIVDGTISRMYWGASGAVDLIEGCT